MLPVYSSSISVPANTTEAARNITELKLTPGIITRVFLDYPWGTRRYLNCRMLHGETQIIPLNPGGSFKLDDKLLVLEPNYLLEVAPISVKVWAWNVSYRNAHELGVIVEVQDPRLIFPLFALDEILTDLREKQASLYKIVTGEVLA